MPLKWILTFSVALLLLPAPSQAKAQGLEHQVAATVEDFLHTDPGLKVFFNRAYGYAVFPRIAKGGLIVGGAFGEGLVFVHHKIVGRSRVKQLTLGLQVGGQSFAQILFFKNQAAFKHFIRGQMEFGAQASAVALDAGVGTHVEHDKDVVVFTKALGGLMYEAALSGQVFSYLPKY